MRRCTFNLSGHTLALRRMNLSYYFKTKQLISMCEKKLIANMKFLLQNEAYIFIILVC